MKNRIITLQKTVYFSGQNREEGACVQPNSNILYSVHNDIISEERMKREFNWEHNKWEFFPRYIAEKGGIDYYSHNDWNGLRKMFPYVDEDWNVECLVTVVFESKDVSYWNSTNQIDEYERFDDLYNFHSESVFYGVSTENYDIMLSKGKNDLYWKLDDGYIKWDCDRNNGAIIWGDSPFKTLFPHSNTDGHSIGVPYKTKVIVDAVI